MWLLVFGVSLIIITIVIIVRVSKSTLLPDEDLQCGVEMLQSISK